MALMVHHPSQISSGKITGITEEGNRILFVTHPPWMRPAERHCWSGYHFRRAHCLPVSLPWPQGEGYTLYVRSVLLRAKGTPGGACHNFLEGVT